MSDKITFIVCPYLVVYKDSGYASNGTGYGTATINNCECNALKRERPCFCRGRCLIAKETLTWRQVSSKSFGVRE